MRQLRFDGWYVLLERKKIREESNEPESLLPVFGAYLFNRLFPIPSHPPQKWRYGLDPLH